MTTASLPLTQSATFHPTTHQPVSWTPGRIPTDAELADWTMRFDRDGFLVLHNVLDEAHVAALKADLLAALEEPQVGGADFGSELRCRLFERSAANVRLFDLEPVVSFAEALVAPDCHVMCNNSFRTKPGTRLAGWHQDDAPHFLVTHGERPTNIRLPVLLFTANYYLTDVSLPENGPTVLIPGSHLFGSPCPSEPTEEPAYACGPAGSVALFNNQTWHCSGMNSSQHTRLITQVSYGRRIIGHKYNPFMNYQMPEHVYRDANPRLRRLLGFLPTGYYG